MKKNLKNSFDTFPEEVTFAGRKEVTFMAKKAKKAKKAAKKKKARR